MQCKALLLAICGWVTFLSNATPAIARLGKFTITDGSTEQVSVKYGLFGHKVIVKDKLGNGYEGSRSIFGLTKDTRVGVLGNEVHSHKGLFGFSKTDVHTILGDTVTSNKNPIYRNTNINLQGIDGLMSKYTQPNQPKMPFAVPTGLNQGQSYNLGPFGSYSPTVSPSTSSPSNTLP
jgi:hypothetical protein